MVEVRIIGLEKIPEVKPKDNLGEIIVEALERQKLRLTEGDILVVTQKVVSKAEGRVVSLRHVVPSPLATRLALHGGKDPRQVEVVLQESKSILRLTPSLIISETRHGFICANAAVDRSNVPDGEAVTLLPEDPDASAQRLREHMKERLRVEVAVIISDTFGRPWRHGLTNVAVGVAGMKPLLTHLRDSYGFPLKASVIAVVDELASAAELVMRKSEQVPVVLIRGYQYLRGEGAAKELIRDAATDLFR